MDKLEQIKQKIQEYQNKTAVTQDLKAFLTLVLNYIKTAKEDLSTISQEQFQTISEAINFMQKEHENITDTVLKDNRTTKQELTNLLSEAKTIVENVKKIKAIPGKDGLDGYTPLKGHDYFTDKEIKDIKDSIVTDLQETPESIKEKLETLKDEDRLDASAIKNLPEATKRIVGGVVARNVWQLGDVVLTNLADSEVLAYDATNKVWVNTTAGAGDVTKVGTPVDNQIGVWTGDGSIEGTAGLTYDGSSLDISGDINFTNALTSIGDMDITAGGAFTTTSAINSDISFFPDANSGTGRFKIYNSGASVAGTFDFESLASARTYTFPDKSGTVAMTSDISGSGIAESLAIAYAVSL